LLNETDFADAGLLFLPGGMPGTRNLDALPELKEIILAQVNGNKPVAAICAAPLIFGKMGLLNGKEAICYPGFEGELQGATISGTKIVKDGLVHTAQGAGVAVDFALMLVAELKGKAVADQLAKAICLVG
jgi:4-methyl-5(b-hydroxyethyl)-thiazole monophosphate biosynthesis